MQTKLFEMPMVLIKVFSVKYFSIVVLFFFFIKNRIQSRILIICHYFSSEKQRKENLHYILPQNIYELKK